MQERFKPYEWSEEDRFYLEPFTSNLDGTISVLRNLPPELTGALCSRASRASKSLLRVLLDEYIYPIVHGEDKVLADELTGVVRFFHDHGFKNILNNQRAQQFYTKWLAQYGDDSIAQMTGTHLIFWGISQVAMKFIEDQRIGLEPIEKSTRYVSFAKKIPDVEENERYLYHIPEEELDELGLRAEYEEVLNNLFDTYARLLPKLIEYLKTQYTESDSVLEKKAFDTLRGLLPMATLGQVALRGNAQAFEYLINRTGKHELSELARISRIVKTELDKEIPSLLLRSESEPSQQYQEYLALKRKRVKPFAECVTEGKGMKAVSESSKSEVRLIEFDPQAPERILAGILFGQSHLSWDACLTAALAMSEQEKEEMFDRYLGHRKERWHKVGRALENSYLRFEITTDIGAYRDLHRHRMMTQERQYFSCHHGYAIPSEVQNAGLELDYRAAMDRAAELFMKIEGENPAVAQYVVPLGYKIRFYEWQNFRQFFWEVELRSTSQGHPEYRHVEHAKYWLVKEQFPLLTKHMKVDLQEYGFARRGTEQKIQEKEAWLLEKLKK
ncbi:MAG: hypothetical protein A3H06_02070 [Candidatus Colwellbacteria bacterium RIFCSPLOWO2_12_FULL_44_13]|uniref:Thymidylate synthase n=3 Tax=Candidatus Colwelliibacteriota TaxID=1817904 RepID=A0A1G1Z856_9BACT|nr:MAG: hypothetical protein A3F24_01500 [Candidatus Colwellbacteria bacterium RIFCSPHIGHO2_12_FULL_44_17]OGY60821.1 MAG: hypothetical protein A3I31_02475 [Candidatus Colwellbacteria bacterium RIFCSPLOWO2_02_FULL_44_20b]OGY62009.1 MAG: hypothetical protein A3H06_02070 [Candidatus Colwellbacteria bacterium RIFCSPLOWO2_12_FULL_44_13]